MIVIDACVLIALLQFGHPHADRAAAIMGTEEELLLHPLSLAEALVGAVRVGREKQYRYTLASIGIETWSPDDDHPYRLAHWRATTTLKMPDCCVLDTAHHLSASLATFDIRFAQIATGNGVSVVS